MKKNPLLYRLILCATLGLTIWALLRVWQVMVLLEIGLFQPKWFVLWGGLSAFFVAVLTALGLTWSPRTGQWFSSRFDRCKPSASTRMVLLAIFGLIMIAYPWFILFSPIRGILAESTDSPGSVVIQRGTELLLIDSSTPITGKPNVLQYGAELNATGFNWWLLWIICLITAGILKLAYPKFSFGKYLILVAIWEAALYRIGSFFPILSNYPFTLWEESYRIYYASLVAAQRVYGSNLQLSPIDFSLNLLNGIPFLLSDFPIWIHRLWYVILSIGLTILTTVLLSKRLRIEDRLLKWMFSGWLILYLLSEGGIHYHLLICIILVLIGFSKKHFWRSFIFVMATSIWAGTSRMNWYPVPGMLAAVLFFLEEPVVNYKSTSSYLWKPVLWVIGGFSFSIAISLLVFKYLLPDQSVLTGYVTSRLLWYRLFPNPTYPLGILLATLLTSFPLWWICSTSRRGNWHPIRIAGLMGLITVLFVGGLVVSVKIGGGADLHNMDAYMIFMVIAAAYVLFKRFAAEEIAIEQRPSWAPALLLLAFPIWSAFVSIQPRISCDPVTVEQQLQAIHDIVEPAAQQGEVLFLYQRPLLTFGEVDAPLVPEYEHIYLMEMAMNNTETYLDEFQADLANHRFQLIISVNQPTMLKGRNYAFGEENDAWYYAVTEPLLESYTLVAKIHEIQLEFYIPSAMPDK